MLLSHPKLECLPIPEWGAPSGNSYLGYPIPEWGGLALSRCFKMARIDAGNGNQAVFDEFCHENFILCPNSASISREKMNRIVGLLRQPAASHSDAKFSWWVRNKKFVMLTLPQMGIQECLCIPAEVS